MPTLIDTTYELFVYSTAGLVVMAIVVSVMSAVITKTAELIRDALAGVNIGG